MNVYIAGPSLNTFHLNRCINYIALAVIVQYSKVQFVSYNLLKKSTKAISCRDVKMDKIHALQIQLSFFLFFSKV